MALVSVGLLIGCQSESNPLKKIPITEGFEVFDTPRDFHGPGTVLRRAPNGTVYWVGTILLDKSSGNESFPNITKGKTLTADAIFQTIGIPAEKIPASIKLDLNRTANVIVNGFDAKREQTDDSYLSKLASFFATRPVLSDNVYYIIRETIASRHLSYSSSSEWLAQLNSDATVQEWVKLSGNTKFGGTNALTFEKVFPEPMYIMYKREELVFEKDEGGGPNQYTIKSKPAVLGDAILPRVKQLVP